MAKILVVDDDPDIRELLREQLEASGHTVLEAKDGKAGIFVLERVACDLVITDVHMPNSNGLALINEMHGLDHLLPVIAISGGSPRDADLQMLSISSVLGANAVLAKPFTHDELLRTVDQVLKQAS